MKIKDYFQGIDTKTLSAVLALCIFGTFIMFSVSPAIAHRIHIYKFQIAIKHLAFLVASVIIMFKLSKLSTEKILRYSIVGYGIFVVLLFLVLIVGSDIKGSKRWIRIPFLAALQPSEILKPFFIVVNAMFVQNLKNRMFSKITASVISLLVISALLIKEPDFGMFCIYVSIWITQLFVAGFPLKNMLQIIASILVAIVVLITTLPHARQRMTSFLDKDKAPSYQVEKAIQSMIEGGDFGKGPGDGTVKFHLPDVYTDYIFSAIGEEFGYVICCLISLIYLYIVVHNLIIARNEPDMMKANIIVGTVTMFGLQSFINIGVNVNLLPSKGMTLPFISYGGSAIIGMSICFGILLSITSKQSGYKNKFNLY